MPQRSAASFGDTDARGVDGALASPHALALRRREARSDQVCNKCRWETVREQDRRRAAIGRPGEHLKRAAPLSGIVRHPDTIARKVSSLMVAGWVLQAILVGFLSVVSKAYPTPGSVLSSCDVQPRPAHSKARAVACNRPGPRCQAMACTSRPMPSGVGCEDATSATPGISAATASRSGSRQLGRTATPSS